MAILLLLLLFSCCLLLTGSFFLQSHAKSRNLPLRAVLPDENSLTLDELKAELELRGVDYSDCVSKKELSDRLKANRLQGRADPKILDQFNENFDPTLVQNADQREKVFDQAVMEDIISKDGNLPGGLPPDMMKTLASDPEIMRMLQDPKMQDIMRTMMTGGPDAVKKYLADPDAVSLLDRLSKAMQRVTEGKQ